MIPQESELGRRPGDETVGAAEFHFIIALLAGRSTFAGPHLVTLAGYDLGWFDVAALLVGPLSFVEFCHRLLPETRDALELQSRYEVEFARDPEYVERYRFGNAFHGVHPFYMWYWGENGRAHVGKVIVVGAQDKAVAELMGWECAATVREALEMALSHVGRRPTVTFMHIPPISIADVSGTPQTV